MYHPVQHYSDTLHYNGCLLILGYLTVGLVNFAPAHTLIVCSYLHPFVIANLIKARMYGHVEAQSAQMTRSIPVSLFYLHDDIGRRRRWSKIEARLFKCSIFSPALVRYVRSGAHLSTVQRGYQTPIEL